MKTFKTLLAALLFSAALFAQNVGINSDGSAPNGSAMLDVSSTTKGFLAPRMTASERGLIATPATGLLVYQTDASSGYYFNAGTPVSPAWKALAATTGTQTGQMLYWNGTAWVGISPGTNGQLLVWNNDAPAWGSLAIGATTGSGVKDADGNLYSTLLYSNGQEWMGENLKTTKFRDGSSITSLNPASSWVTGGTSSVPGYCWYNYDISNKDTYGALYNGYAVNGINNLCPIGWHVPTLDEWNSLISLQGGTVVAGGKMKEIGITHWVNPNTGADNSSSFTALPAGFVLGDGTCNNMGSVTYFWTSTVDPGNGYKCINIADTQASLYIGFVQPNVGISVRCIKD